MEEVNKLILKPLTKVLSVSSSIPDHEMVGLLNYQLSISYHVSGVLIKMNAGVLSERLEGNSQLGKEGQKEYSRVGREEPSSSNSQDKC